MFASRRSSRARRAMLLNCSYAITLTALGALALKKAPQPTTPFSDKFLAFARGGLGVLVDGFLSERG